MQYSHGGVLEEAVIWVKHVLGEKIEPLSRHTAVIETSLALELDPEPRFEMFGVLTIHDCSEAVF